MKKMQREQKQVYKNKGEEEEDEKVKSKKSVIFYNKNKSKKLKISYEHKLFTTKEMSSSNKKRKSHVMQHLYLFTGLLLLLSQGYLFLRPDAIAHAASVASAAPGVAPSIDYSHNMRILKLPKSTKVGDIIYRLKASGGHDPGGQLRFGLARGLESRALVDIVPTPNSWNEADVYLRARLSGIEGPEVAAAPSPDDYSPYLQAGPTRESSLGDDLASDQTQRRLQLAAYNLTIFVADASNKTTQVDSTIIVTNDDNDDVDAAAGHDQNAVADAAAAYEADGAGPSEQGGGATATDQEEQQRRYAGAYANRTYTSSGPRTNTSSLAASSSLAKRPYRVPVSGSHTIQLSPFLRPRHVFSVPENAQVGESLGFLTVRESEKSDLPVRFELRGAGSDLFALRYVFGPRVGQSRAELILSAPVDYERQNLFQLKVLALNAWTNSKFDTRNVATLDIVIGVGDVQDTAPVFRSLPRALRLANTARPGDVLARIQAEDGDYADQRPIQYVLDASSPLAQHFAIDKKSGELTLARSVYELAAALHQSELSLPRVSSGGGETPATLLTILASELPDASSYDHLWPPMIARAELPLELVDATNEAPRFVGYWLLASGAGGGGSLAITPILRGYLREFSNGGGGIASEYDDSLDKQTNPSTASGGQVVQWYTNWTSSASTDLYEPNSGASIHSGSPGAPNWAHIAQQLLRSTRGRPLVIDLGQGANGTFELSLEGPDAHLFELWPSHAINRMTTFQLQVAPTANRSLFDFDHQHHSSYAVPSSGDITGSQHPGRFNLELVARDFGSPVRASARLRCQIDLLDVNDNAPQFDSDLYTFSINENASPGQILGSVHARDMDRVSSHLAAGAYQRVRYVSLTGRDHHLFRLDPDSGLITLEGQLDREKQDHYLLLAEARDASGQAANYTKIVVNVLDVNDNAPVFTQAHYDAVLLADGSFYQPLVVSAVDADELSSANSQVAYEIIAGNQNDQFMIDSLSGAIYPTATSANYHQQSQLPSIRPLPSILSEPILPYVPTNPVGHQQVQGKILPQPSTPRSSAGGVGGSVGLASTHEIEETTVPSGHLQQPLRLNWPRSAGLQQGDVRQAPVANPPGLGDHTTADPTLAQAQQLDANLNRLMEQYPALDLMLNVDASQPESLTSSLTHRHQVRASGGGGGGGGGGSATPSSPNASPAGGLQTAQSQRGSYGGGQLPASNAFDASRVAPLTTLVVRAHDFGIPLRSATCKVNIYNQALLQRTISVILNGTAEQLEQRREMIERAFGALTGSRASIESLDALSDSSSISVARVKLAIPAGHSLIDLTDLSSLMTAIDYKLPSPPAPHTTSGGPGGQHLDQFKRPVHYITTGDKIYPVHSTSFSSNISGNSAVGSTFYTDLTQIEAHNESANMLERKLLFYIIIVGICILALLVIWMIYFCCRETDQQQQQLQQTKVLAAAGTGKHHKGRDLRLASSDSSSLDFDPTKKLKAHAKLHKHKTSSKTRLMDDQQQRDIAGGGGESGRMMANSVSQLDLAEQMRAADKQQLQVSLDKNTRAKMMLDELGNVTSSSTHPIGQNLAKHQLSIPSNSLKPDHLSMYNGQVWFEQGGLLAKGGGGGGRRPPTGASERRASSAPSVGGNSLDSSLHAIMAGRSSALSPASSGGLMMLTPAQLQQQRTGQFFPNTLGYANNLATIAAPSGGAYVYPPAGHGQKRSGALGRGSRKVAPMIDAAVGTGGDQLITKTADSQTDRKTAAGGATNEAFEQDLESGGDAAGTRQHRHSSHHHRHHHHAKSRHHLGTSRHSCTSSASSSSSRSTRTGSSASQTQPEESDGHETVLLDSDQELLGFDSMGTPIIATHTRNRGGLSVGVPGGGSGESGKLTEGSGLAGSNATTVSGRTTSSSPATTVIHMNQAAGSTPAAVPVPPPPPTSSVELESQSAAAKSAGEKVTDNKDEQRVATTDGAAGGATTTTTTISDSSNRKAVNEDGGSGAKGEVAGEARRDSQVKIAAGAQVATGAAQRKPSADLMSELNERLGSANKQRALRRQSADINNDDDAEESQQQQQRQQQRQQRLKRPSGPLAAGSAVAVATRPLETTLAADNSSAQTSVTKSNDRGEDQRETEKEGKEELKLRAGALPSASNNQDQSSRTCFAAAGKAGRCSESMTSCQSSTASDTFDITTNLRDMKNGELLEKQSIFAMTYSGLAADKLPS